MGLWEFLQQWRGGRTAAGVAASLLLHVVVVAAVLWGAKLPIAERWRTKPGEALIVELPKPDESPSPGVPDAPDAPVSPNAPPVAVKTPPRPAPARPQPPAPRQVASAPRPAEPVKSARPAEQRPAEPRAAGSARPAEAPTERGTDKAPAASEPAPTEGAAADSAPVAPSRAPSGVQVASVPPGGAPGGQALPDIRSALRRGAGGRGQGWAGIEGDPIRLDAVDSDYSEFLEQVRRQIKAKWGYPCIKNPTTHNCDYYNARVEVVFGIQKSGRLQVVEVHSSSGYEMYDGYAVTAVRLAAPYPPVPAAMLAKFKTTNVGVPILAQFTYILESGLTNVLR